MRKSMLCVVGLTLAGFACSASGTSGSGQFSGGAGGSSASTGSGGSGAIGAFGGSAGFIGTEGGKPGPSCQFVDILFLIDDSPSMGDPQEKLATQWPAFVDAMFDKLPPNVNMHVGMVTTGFFTGSCSESTTNCRTGQTPQEVDDHFIRPSEGNTMENGGQGRLFQHQGKTFFEANTSDTDHAPLKSWFAGAATAAGETGCSYEFSSAGVAYTTDPVNAQHNAGFYRDRDGVLVLIFLTDEPDKSFEGVQLYHDMVTGVKSSCGGNACIITAGLIAPCVQSTNQELWQFMNSFGKPPVAVGDIEGPATEYSKVVGDALAQVVRQTCDSIAVPH